MNVEKKTSLADKIADIFNIVPSVFDPDDCDSISPKVLHHEYVEPNKNDEIFSKFRRANVDLLVDLDEKYAGKKTKRKSFEDSASDEEEEEEEEDGDDMENNSGNLELSVFSNNLGNYSNEDNSEEDDDNGNCNYEEIEEDEFDDNFKHIKDTNVPSQIKKGLCVRNQMGIWENLLEVRIQLQKCLLTANKLPQDEVFKTIKEESGSEYSNSVSQTINIVSATLDKLLLLQKLLLKQNLETKKLEEHTMANNSVVNADVEVISSDTDNEESSSEEVVESRKGVKRKFTEYEEILAKQHEKYKDYRNNVIQKWNDKTRVVLKGTTSSHSVLDQIKYNLSNKEKLIKRTQIKRSQYSILGQQTSEEHVDEEYNPEIFDDDDFYHQLLRELIEIKSADVTDPIQLGRQWIQLQNMRSKMKRKIDTRATKGRKIRYAVHSKLVNFMAPIDENSWNDETKNELYNSLFGKII